MDGINHKKWVVYDIAIPTLDEALYELLFEDQKANF